MNQENGNLLEQASGRWLEIMAALLPEMGPAIASFATMEPHVSCPVHGSVTGDNNGFRIFNDGNDKGGGICNTCGPFPTGIYLIAWLLRARDEKWADRGETPPGYNVKKDKEYRVKATKLVAEYLEHGSVLYPEVMIRVPMPKKFNEKQTILRNSALRRFSEAAWVKSYEEHPAIQSYLEERGHPLVEIPGVCRFNPQMHFGNGIEVSYHPAILLPLIRGIQKEDGEVENQVVGIHRIYLEKTPEGKYIKNTSMKEPKRTTKWEDIEGAYIPLFIDENSEFLVEVEGFETGHAARIFSGLPVNSYLTAWGLEHAPIPKQQCIIIAEDYDISGRGKKAADIREQVLRNAGKEVHRLPPFGGKKEIPSGLKGIDWDYMIKFHTEDGYEQWQKFSIPRMEMPAE